MLPQKPDFFKFSGRTAVWVEGLNLFKKSPWIGFGFHADRLLVCGGGVHNRDLLNRLARHCGLPADSTEDAGVAPEWVEAAAFAWLAWAFWERVPGNAPQVTGAGRSAVLGHLSLP
mgnify:CR=1 FL=1